MYTVYRFARFFIYIGSLSDLSLRLTFNLCQVDKQRREKQKTKNKKKKKKKPTTEDPRYNDSVCSLTFWRYKQFAVV